MAMAVPSRFASVRFVKPARSGNSRTSDSQSSALIRWVSTMPAVIVGTCRTMSAGIVATKCGSCGIVGVYVNGSVIVKINLDADSTHYRQLILLPRFSRRTGTVTVKVLTSGKAMEIDGLLVNRS
jgi:hypothetical protein